MIVIIMGKTLFITTATTTNHIKHNNHIHSRNATNTDNTN